MKTKNMYWILSFFVFILFNITTFGQSVSAGQNVVINPEDPVTLNGTIPSGWCFAWWVDGAATHFDKTTLTPLISPGPSTSTIYKLVAVKNELTSKEAKVLVFVSPAYFKEFATQKYGFDSYTNPPLIGPPGGPPIVPPLPWKSIKKGDTDKVLTDMDANFAQVFFKSTVPAKVTVEPDNATAQIQELTLTALDVGQSEIQANQGNVNGPNLAKMNVKSYNEITKTVCVRLVHSKAEPGIGYPGYTSTDIPDADIIAYLNTKTYNQAVCKWIVTRLDPPSKTVEFDDNHDLKLDVSTWMTPEMTKIKDACKDDTYQYNIFLVDNPSDESYGFMDYNQKYGFVHPDFSPHGPTTVAHELGHGAFGLIHKTGLKIPENLMTQGEQVKWRLFINQWNIINP